MSTQIIPRNTKRFAQVLQNATGIKVLALDNGFRAQPISENPLSPIAWASRKPGEDIVHITPQQYLSETAQCFKFAKLYQDGENAYRLRVTGNEWYTFSTEEVS